MNFDQLVDRLTSLYDVSNARAVDVANERLQRLVVASKSLRAIKSIATTTAAQASYPLDPTIVQVSDVKATYSTGQVNYDGNVSIDELWNVDAGTGTLDPCGAYYALEPDADSTETTDNLRLYPAPPESGITVYGLVVLMPAAITYGSSAALPIHLDVHEHLLAGCKAELSDEEGRQDEGAKFESVFAAGTQLLKDRVNSRAKGTARHRLNVVGYDRRR